MLNILHILSQRPSQTGSGVTLQALIDYGEGRGYSQAVVAAGAQGEAPPEVGSLPEKMIFPLFFEQGSLNFPIPGMFDVMPYKSTRFSSMTVEQIEVYQQSWAKHLREVKERFQPDIIHSNHIWLLSALLKDIFPQTPIVTHCHATGLRQMELCPKLKEPVRVGCARNEHFVVLHQEHADLLAQALDIPSHRIDVVGAGYRDKIFYFDKNGRKGNQKHILYAGKYSQAKGVPYLLDAFEKLSKEDPTLILNIAGSGSGEEADTLHQRMQGMGSKVRIHGQVGQEKLAELMRQAHVFVLPSMYEGLPLVLVEAFACGCRLVSTDLSGVREQIAPHLGEAISLVPQPEMRSVDQPLPTAAVEFTSNLVQYLKAALDAPTIGQQDENRSAALKHFRWESISERIDRIWRRLV
ncbi:MAG: hypothetical protein CMH60_03695 [Myxococcales bacterium]|nr:hypothetical protein [Myxococcales bacterium]